VTLVLAVAAGYALGRIVCHVGNLFLKVIVQRWLWGSPAWRAIVRRTIQREAQLQATLIGPWVTRRR
jgi:hypothetical protein